MKEDLQNRLNVDNLLCKNSYYLDLDLSDNIANLIEDLDRVKYFGFTYTRIGKYEYIIN